MKWFVGLLLLLAACSQFSNFGPTDSNESLITGEVVANLTPENENATVEPQERIDIIVEDANVGAEGIVSVFEQNVSEPIIDFVEIPKDYTVGQVHSLTPELENVVKSSVCYNYTWAGIEDYQKQHNLKVAKSVRFSYLGARLFKGWILSTLTLNEKQVLASKNVQVLVNEMNVTCVDEGNFTIDWEAAVKK